MLHTSAYAQDCLLLNNERVKLTQSVVYENGKLKFRIDGWMSPVDAQGTVDIKSNAPSFNQTIVTDVSGEKDEILAEALDVAVLGNHPIQFEPFAFSMLETEGRWNSDPLVDDICNGNITLLVLVYPLDADIHPVGLKEFPMWPNSVVTALRQTMVHEQTRDYHFLYRTRPGLTPAAIAECKTAAAAARVVER